MNCVKAVTAGHSPLPFSSFHLPPPSSFCSSLYKYLSISPEKSKFTSTIWGFFSLLLKFIQTIFFLFTCVVDFQNLGMSDCTISSLDMDDVSSPVKFIPASSCEASSDSADLPEALSLMESSLKQSMSREWTDEKHSMYLKSMEASFVNQLYTSLDLLGCHSQKKHSSDSKPSRQMHAGVRVPSGQFKVLRGGNWGNVNFERNGPQLGKADESCALLSNQWIRRFRFGCVNLDESSPTHLSKAPLENHTAYLKEKTTITSALAADTKQSNLCNSHLDSVGSRTEASGQNFIDEDIEGDKASVHGAQTAKRKNVASLSYDQVVPFSSFATTENVNKAH